jgi:hypothetical protein
MGDRNFNRPPSIRPLPRVVKPPGAAGLHGPAPEAAPATASDVAAARGRPRPPGPYSYCSGAYREARCKEVQARCRRGARACLRLRRPCASVNHRLSLTCAATDDRRASAHVRTQPSEATWRTPGAGMAAASVTLTGEAAT